MDMYSKYQSPLGYNVGENGIDSYGVDHKNFTLQDEVQYQNLRHNREQEVIKQLNEQGITENYPQYGTNFWGGAENNYGFGDSNIVSAVQNHQSLNTTPIPLNNQQPLTPIPATKPSGQSVLPNQAWRNAENSLLSDGLDTLYGMNRAVNGITFGGLDWLGGKLGIDTQMNDYLDLKDAQNRQLTQLAGDAAELGGSALTGRLLAKTGYNQANMAYNGYKIGKSYDKLKENPYQGSGSDIIVRMKNHNGEPVVLQRGEAIKDAKGNVIASGNDLKHVTGSKSNYGLNKGIYRHDVAREDVKKIPRMIQQQPVETNSFGQYEYLRQTERGPFRVVTSPKDDENIISTMYYVDR
ncbi:MAG: hypothetical protein IJ564_02255 [Alphaproteobacteria bacterium]|nr:hypothetical protein [Alphaproteobacteria bacterium]